ncbi:MAG: ABC transporter permease, partial [Bacteroidota bacterium]
MEQDLPEVVKAARINVFFDDAGSNIVRASNQTEGSFQKGFVYIDPEFGDLFSFEALKGNPATWLEQPNSIVITESVAKQFFGDTNPVDQSFILNEDPEDQYRITGVIKDLPKNTHLDYDYFMSMSTLPSSESNNWISNAYFAYVQLAENAEPAVLQDKLYDFGLKYFAPQFREQLNIDLSENRTPGVKYDLFLQPLKDVHLRSSGFTPYMPGGDIRYVRLFGAIAIFLLFIAIVNFINLSTARSANRAKEVGMRKVLGSVRTQLIRQFLMESVLICLVAFVIGVVVADQSLPFFNYLSEISLKMPYQQPWFWASCLALALGIGALAGVYPAFYLSGFQPIKVLKGRLSLGGKSAVLRKSLVVLQFSISTGLIVATMVVFQQMDYIRNKRIGFDKDQVILLHDTQMLEGKLGTLKEQIQTLPEVANASSGSFLPFEGGFRNQMMYHLEDNNDPTDRIAIQAWPVDEDYLTTLGMNLLEGRNFDPSRETDANTVILNQTALGQLGIENPLGKRIKSPFGEQLFTIIGVVEDFNYESLKTEIEGLGLFYGRNAGTLSVKVSAGEMDGFLRKAEGIWAQFLPQQPLRYTFLDERFEQMYKKETQSANLFNIFTGLAIFIACLGLFA